jgi:hypothetical protein
MRSSAGDEARMVLLADGPKSVKNAVTFLDVPVRTEPPTSTACVLQPEKFPRGMALDHQHSVCRRLSPGYRFSAGVLLQSTPVRLVFAASPALLH